MTSGEPPSFGVPPSGGIPALPGPLRLARNAAAALLRTSGRALAWQSILVSDQVAFARQQVCQNGCQFYRVSDQRCAHPECGCFLAGKLLSKWKLITEQCPLKKWPV
jgi:hypothetical protein